MEVIHIISIDEMAMQFNAEVVTELTWRDSRHTYKNLAENENFLDADLKNKIWLPHLIFSNTDGNMALSIDSKGRDKYF